MNENLDTGVLSSEQIDQQFKHAINVQDIISIKQFIKLTSDITYVCRETGKTALHIISKFSSFCDTDVNESNNLIKWLIQEKHVDVNIRDAGDWTPLHLACRFTTTTSHISTVKLLLELGANVNAITNKETPPIILAVNETRRASSDEVVSLLLDYGSPIDGIYKMMTPLMYACRDSHVECENDDFKHCKSSLTTVELLLKRGANPNIIINDVSPLMLTYAYIPRGNTHVDTLKMLVKYGANQHLLVGGTSFYRIISEELREQLIPKLIESEDVIEHKDLSEPECMFCLDSNPTVKFDCGHICVCTNCYKFVHECYTCFELVKTFRRIKIKYT